MISYKVNTLSSETELNKLLRNHKRFGGNLTLLFTSPWDKTCQRILSKIKVDENSTEVLNVVNLFETPHTAIIFNTNRVPHLIAMGSDGIMSDDYVPRIFEFFGTL